MPKSAIHLYLPALFVFCSGSSSALSKKVHILIGDVGGAKIFHFDKIENIFFWFTERGVGLVANFSEVERDLEGVRRHPLYCWGCRDRSFRSSRRSFRR